MNDVDHLLRDCTVQRIVVHRSMVGGWLDLLALMVFAVGCGVRVFQDECDGCIEVRWSWPSEEFDAPWKRIFEGRN